MVDLVERINVLLEQEKCSYETEDYLAPGFQQRLRDDLGHPHSHEFLSCSSGSTSTSGINEVWREKICEWSYQVIDHFDFSREIVSIAVSYLDRYLSRRPVNKKHFQLLAMSCLYLAIKLYEPGTVSMKSMIDLSRGYFLVEHMVEMEMSILRYVARACFLKSLSSSTVRVKERWKTLRVLPCFVLDFTIICRVPL